MIDYTISVSNCYILIKNTTNSIVDDYKLSNIRINYDSKVFTIVDGPKVFTIAIANLSTINAGAFSSFDALWVYIDTARSACLESNNALDGDVTGIFANNLVSKIQGKELPTSQPADKNIYMYDFAKNKFVWKNIYSDFSNIIFCSVLDGTSITGVTTEQISSINEIEAGSITINNMLRYFSLSKYTGTSGTKIKRVWINIAPNLSGAMLVAVSTVGTNLKKIDGMDRILAVKSTTNTEVMYASGNSNTSSSINNNAVSSLNIDWTVKQYILETEQLSNAADIAICSQRYLEKLPIT